MSESTIPITEQPVQVRSIGRQLAREITHEELEAVSGGFSNICTVSCPCGDGDC